MLNYAYGAGYSRCETPFALAKASEEYYKSSLKKCRINYETVDEHTFSNIKTSKLTGYENIIICDACALTDKDKHRITKLKSAGLRINEKKILDMLDRVN